MTMRRVVTLLILLAAVTWSAVAVDASYTTATIVVSEPQQDGRTRLVVRFTGNAGEPAVDRDIWVDGSTTALAVRQWRDGQIAALDASRSLSRGGAMQPGQVIPAAPAPATPSQAEQDRLAWMSKAQRLERLKRLGLTNATAVSEVAALEADVNATYQAGYAASY